MLIALIVSCLREPEYDLILRNGSVVDGTGAAGYHADVAIRGDKIVRIAPHLSGAKTYVDETGQTICPGFIDVHTHAENILQYPRAWNFVHDGVTTVVIGNCGGSTLDVKGFFEQLVEKKPSINVATLVGHNSVRTDAMHGTFDRAPTALEMSRMESLVSRAMKDGALGFSTGLEYVPGAYAKTSEIVGLAKIAHNFGGMYTTHMRSEGVREKEALQESFQIGREAGLPVEISHIKLDSKPVWGEAKARTDQIDAARKKGVAITQDVYPYTAYSTTLGLLLPASAFDGGAAGLRQKLANSLTRGEILDGMAAIRKEADRSDYSWVAIASNDDPRLNGMRIPEAARRRKGSDSLENQIELILDLVQQTHSSGVFFAMDEADLDHFLLNPRTMIISDSTVEPLNSAEVPHPRAYGSNARVLAEFVRNRKILSLEEAVRRMTFLPADTFKIAQRGQLKEGYFADVVVFDPARITDRATFQNPRVYPTGIRDVIVNGKFVLHNGAETESAPGTPVKRAP